MINMASGETPSREEPHNLPKISPEIIRTFADLPNTIEERYRALRDYDPDMARELFITADNYGHDDMKQKRAFAAGALFMYGLLQYDRQRKHLETLISPPTSDDADDEDQQP